MVYINNKGGAKIGFMEHKRAFSLDSRPDSQINTLESLAMNFTPAILCKMMFALGEKEAIMEFSKVAHSPEKMSHRIANDIYKKYNEKSLDELISLNVKLSEDIFPTKIMAWIKKNEDVCHYLWVYIVSLKWEDILSSPSMNLYNSYIAKHYKNNEVVAVDFLGIPALSLDHNYRYTSLVKFFEILPFPSEMSVNYFNVICEDYKNAKAKCHREINVKNMLKSDELISFALDYFKKKGSVKREALEPFTDHDNRSALITRLYLECQENNEFGGRVKSLAKAWSQHKTRKVQKKVADKIPGDAFKVLSKLNVIRLREIAKKFEISESEILNESIETYYKHMMKS